MFNLSPRLPPVAARRRRCLAIESLESRAMLAAGVASRPDLLAASDAGTSSTDNKTNVTTPTFEGTATDAATVRLLVGSVVAGEVPVVDGRWTFTHPGLASGKHSVKAQAVAADGSLGTRSSALAIEIRTAIPAAPTLGILQANGRPTTTASAATNRSRPTFAGLGPTRGTVEVSVDGVSVGTRTVPTNRKFSVIPAAPLASGTRSVTAVARDLFGNTSSPATLALSIDSEPPVAVSIVRNSYLRMTVEFSEPVKGLTPSAFRFSGRTLDGMTIPARQMSDRQVTSYVGPVNIQTSNDGRSFTLEVAEIGLPVGEYLITIPSGGKVTDLAGNPLSNSVSLPVSV